MELMDNVDAFSLKGGYVTVNFTNLGEIGSIDVHRRYGLIN